MATLVEFSAMMPSSFAAKKPQELRLNQIQVIGTHNSYHSGMSPVAMTWLQRVAPKHAEELDYRHGDIKTQLDHGVRQLEIDIYVDREGDHFTHPRGPAWEQEEGLRPDAGDLPSPAMREQDFKVLHIVDIDQHSNCEPLRTCLGQIRDWSDAHPDHIPIFVLLETKQGKGDGSVPNHTFTAAEPFAPEDYDRLDYELRHVLMNKRLIVPDTVRGRFETLDEAVRSKNWPLLSQSRGKIVFLFDQKHDNVPYLLNHPALRGRVVFTNAEPGDADAAFVKRNNGPEADIRRLVTLGYLVRTRADEGTREGRSGDTAKRDAALRSGAQIVSTDYPWFEPARWSGYTVALPGQSAARCNPVDAPGDCDNASLVQ